MLNKELLFDYILNNSSDIFIFFNENFYIQEMNAEAENIFSPNKGSLINFFSKYHLDRLFVDSLGEMVRDNKKCKLPKTVFEFENKKYVIEWQVIPLQEKKSENALFLLKGLNVSENYENLEKQVFEEISKELMGSNISLHQNIDIKQSLDFLRTIVANMPGNIYWKDLNSVYMGGNDNVARVCNLSSRADISGITDVELEKKLNWEPGTAARFRQDDINIINSKKSKTFEDTFIQGDGRRVVMLTTKTPILDKDKNAIGVLAASMDISQLKEQEVSLKHAKDKAELANQAKTDFLSNMSHDVKTPLSGMIAFSEMLSFRVQPDSRDLVQGLMHAGKQLMHFFENCIELAKIENTSIVLAKENFSLKHLLNELMQLFQPAIIAKGLLLYIHYSEEIPGRLLGSRINLYRILLNLIGNAIKFTTQGSISISAELSKRSTPKESLIKLKITDTGVGIPKNKQSLIFEKFSRLTPSYQGTYEGHGIGLYIVQQFVESMRGQIHLKSEEGEGSEFTIAIPFEHSLLADDEYENQEPVDLSALQVLPQESLDVLLANASTAEKINTVSEPKKEAPTEDFEWKILLVEDQPMQQMAAKLVLDALHCQVDIADCGQKAIALFEPGKYDLVFMDIGLPDIKGYEVSKRLREMEKSTSFYVPILGLSAHASHEEEQLSTEAGMEEMLSKPLSLAKGKEILRRCVVLEEVKE